MSCRRFGLVLLGVAAICVLLALRGSFVYDFKRYTVDDGLDASRWTWLGVAGAGLLALVAVRRRALTGVAAVANVIAAAALVAALAWTVRATPRRPAAPERPEVNCDNQNIGVACRLGRVLDWSPAPPPAAPSRALLIATLGAYALVGAVLVDQVRRRRGAR
ncbi:MAG: hypothetical protein IPL61_27105 [Myxococcales bacterium]|nr:hypothetical protein [Myxococcales bacterium]